MQAAGGTFRCHSASSCCLLLLLRLLGCAAGVPDEMAALRSGSCIAAAKWLASAGADVHVAACADAEQMMWITASHHGSGWISWQGLASSDWMLCKCTRLSMNLLAACCTTWRVGAQLQQASHTRLLAARCRSRHGADKQASEYSTYAAYK